MLDYKIFEHEPIEHCSSKNISSIELLVLGKNSGRASIFRARKFPTTPLFQTLHYLQDKKENLQILFLMFCYTFFLMGILLNPGFDHWTSLMQDRVRVCKFSFQEKQHSFTEHEKHAGVACARHEGKINSGTKELDSRIVVFFNHKEIL